MKIILSIAIFISICLAFDAVGSDADLQDRQSVMFGVSVEKQWVRDHVFADFNENPIFAVPYTSGTVILYQNSNDEIYLSLFSKDRETLLHKFKDGGAVLSGQIPRVQLLVCEMDGNDQKDVVLVYAENMAGGQLNEVWQQQMLIFLDAKPNPPKQILLASRDLSYTENADRVRSITDTSKPGSAVDVHIQIYPSDSTDRSGTIGLWRSEISVRKPTDVEDEKKAKISFVRYTIDDGNMERLDIREVDAKNIFSVPIPKKTGVSLN